MYMKENKHQINHLKLSLIELEGSLQRNTTK
jgi:hypothetical protein